MSRLHSLSCFIGRAMNLPPVFFKKVPYVSILDQDVPLAELLGKSSARGAHRSSAIRAGQGRKPAKSAPSESNHQLVLEGAISQGQSTRLAINGLDFTITASTWIIGEPCIGSYARVKGRRSQDGSAITASSIVIKS